jgi:hypothetical protein
MRDRTKVASVPQKLDQHRSGELLKMVFFDSVVMEIEWKRDNQSKSLQRPKSSERLNEKGVLVKNAEPLNHTNSFVNW